MHPMNSMNPMNPIDALRRHADARPRDIALIRDREIWRHERLAYEVDRLARALTGLGVKRGERVALHMANLPEMGVACLACLRLGAVAAPLPTGATTEELASLLERLRPALYIGQATLYRRLAPLDGFLLAPDRRFIVGGPAEDPRAQPWARLFGSCAAALDGAEPDANAPALLLATRGQARLVIHTPRMLAATEESFAHLALAGGEVVVSALPMAEAPGIFTLLACIRFGAPALLVESADPDAVLGGVERYAGRWLAGPPAMFAALLERQGLRPRNIGSLRSCLSIGDACPPPLQRRFPAMFGVPLSSVWATAEAVGSLAGCAGCGPVGRIAPGAQARLLDEDGLPVAPGEVGELVLRGPNLAIGYWTGPGRIHDGFSDGWFHSGDLMRRGAADDLWFVSRKQHPADPRTRGRGVDAQRWHDAVPNASRTREDGAVVSVPSGGATTVAAFSRAETMP